MAGIYNFKIEKGSNFIRTIKQKDSAGAYIDFSSCSAKMQIRYGSKSGDLAIELSSDNSRIELTSDSIILSISSQDTKTLNSDNTCYYDLEITNDSETNRLLEGTITISEEVTTEEVE